MATDSLDQVKTICLPDPETAQRLGELPDGMDVLIWAGKGEPPDGIGRTEFLLADYMGAPVAGRALARMPALQVIQLLSAGVEPWLPLVPEGVTLCNGRGVHGGSTAELAVAGMLSLLRRLPHFHDEQAATRWSPQQTDDLDAKRVLILGAGDIGRRIAAAVTVFDAECTFVARTARDGVHAIGELATLLPEHDIVVVALPHTDETHHLIDASALALLPDGAMLVNIARGAIVETDALVGELAAGRMSAFLDVTDPEPLPAEHPLWRAPNLILTPHVGGGTMGWHRRALRLVHEQLTRFAAGKPLLNVVGEAY